MKKNDIVSKRSDKCIAQAAKDQWRKLRECHREALRRQQKKSGQQATHVRLWTYQKQMEFLQPFMKNRNTVGNPTSPLEESQLATLPYEETTNDGEPTEPSENVARKRFKKSTISNDPVMRKFIEESDKRAKKRDELRLPTKYQREVRRNLFQAVSDAEDKAEDEITDKREVNQTYQMNTQRAISITPQPTSSLSCALTQGYPDFFSASNSTSISSVDTNERNCSRHEDDSSRTFFDLL
ncbi:MADF domain-containing protein [Aphis craccivora]|uniref:MADF domain-containing protein n=1 Tax=Aphis craccivora TaxID=307492 RepID=A0A6G0VZR0_APHCR|nr:MADF domain-containing protein [Aphis craccivora]